MPGSYTGHVCTRLLQTVLIQYECCVSVLVILRVSCSNWLEERKSRQKEEAEKRRIAEEESRPVGPVPPPAATDGGVEGGYGGNLRPGEGERHVVCPPCAP